MKYKVEDIKILLEQGRYIELNRIIDEIKKLNICDKNTVDVLNYLVNSSLIDDSSKTYLTELKENIEKMVAIEENNKIEQNTIEDSISQDKTENIEEEILVAVPIQKKEQKDEELKMPELEIFETDAQDNNKTDITNVLKEKGLTVLENVNEIGKNPHITFEINNLSKPYLDNLMLELYNNTNPGIGYLMSRQNTTKQETFTIFLDDDGMDLEIATKKTKEMLEQIKKIVLDTDKEKNYTENMPDNLKNMKQLFVNDAPEIESNQTFNVGYKTTDGIESFYIMADDKNKAYELTEEFGFKPRKYVGAGIVELDTSGLNVDDTKLGSVSKNLDSIDTKPSQVTELHRMQKTLGVYPSIDNVAFTNVKTIILVSIMMIVTILLILIILFNSK